MSICLKNENEQQKSRLPFIMIRKDIAKSLGDIFQQKSSDRIVVYMNLLGRVNNKTKYCFPSISRIVKDTKLSERTVNRVLNDLEAYGFILRKKGKSGTSNKYWFPLEDERFFNPESPDFLEAKSQSKLYRSKAEVNWQYNLNQNPAEVLEESLNMFEI